MYLCSTHSEEEVGWSQVGFEGGKPWPKSLCRTSVDWSSVLRIMRDLLDDITMHVDYHSLCVKEREREIQHMYLILGR